MVNKDMLSQEEEPSQRLTMYYIMALSCVALLSIFGQVLVQNAINNQKYDSKIINLAGRQRFQSQSIVKIILILSDTTLKMPEKARNAYFERLENLLNNWKRFHDGLMVGNLPELNYKVKNSKEIDALFKFIHPHFTQVYLNARYIQDANIYYDSKVAAKEIGSHRDSVLAHEQIFLDTMDKIVERFSYEAEQRVEDVKQKEIVILLITLLLLILEGLLIFRPSAQHIRLSFAKLVESENKARKLLEELTTAYASLSIANNELARVEKEKYLAKLGEHKIKSASIIQGQEDERKRLAADLHDGLGQLLTLLKLKIDKWTTQPSHDHFDNLSEVQALMTETIQEVRNISFNLMPSVLNDFGIVVALKTLCQNIQSKNELKIEFEQKGVQSLRFHNNIEIGLYRIAQESINNALKYAKAGNIQVLLKLEEGFLYLSVEDDGVGFVLKKVKSKKNATKGLGNMEERADILNGTFQIVSKTGKGTKIQVKIPIISE